MISLFSLSLFVSFFVSVILREELHLNPQAQLCHASDPLLSFLLMLSLEDLRNWEAWFVLFNISKKYEDLPYSYWCIAAVKKAGKQKYFCQRSTKMQKNALWAVAANLVIACWSACRGSQSSSCFGPTSSVPFLSNFLGFQRSIGHCENEEQIVWIKCWFLNMNGGI